MHLTKLASVQIVLWKMLEAYHQDPEPVFAAVGLNPELMRKEGARYPLSKVAALWEEMERRIDDPCFGLTAALHWHPSNFGALGYGLLTSTSLRMTLERLIRYHRVISDARFGEISDLGGDLVFKFNQLDESSYCLAREDGAMSWLMSVLRVNYHRDFAPVSVTLLHDEPACSGKYYEFFRCPVTFNSSVCSLVLQGDRADKLLPSGSEQLAMLHDRLSKQYVTSLEAGGIISRVRKMILELLPSGEASLQRVAIEMRVGVRSLQRQLRAEGTTFLEMLNTTRKEVAREYLRDNSMDLTEIAFLLGFSEQSTFSRSFRRWTGTSPHQYRISMNQS